MKKVLPSSPFSSGTEYQIFLDNFCYRCKKHKKREDGFCAFVEQGGCPIENAMEDARFGSPFPSEDIVKIVENGKIVNWNICKSFETDDKGLMKAYKKLFADHPTEKGGAEE